jgi:hypothetical protein
MSVDQAAVSRFTEVRGDKVRATKWGTVTHRRANQAKSNIREVRHE